MSTDALKALLDSGIINEDTRTALSEAWEAKLNEAKEQVRAELREEFARRYDHDKSVMVESLDKMVTESLTAEIKEFMEDKRALAEDRVKFRRSMKEGMAKFEKFMTSKLAEEIKELRSDRKIQKESVQKLEKFVISKLSEEINEFATDKKELVETKVKLVAQAKDKLDEVQKKFVKNSAKLVKEAISSRLDVELNQLKEDISQARENMFGRKLFEAFSTEFAATHMNENQMINKMQKQIAEKDKQILEAKKTLSKARTIMESKDTQARIVKDQMTRGAVLGEMLDVLNKDKRQVMAQLLENVQTDRLKSAFDKYLPAVLNNTAKVEITSTKKTLTESKSAITGDKTAKTNAENVVKIDEIKRLAGLN
jgi:hypothetical protein